MSLNLNNYIKEISSLDQVIVQRDDNQSFENMIDMVDKLCEGANEPSAILFSGNSDFSFLFNALGSVARVKCAMEIDSFKEITSSITTAIQSFTRCSDSIIDRLNYIKSANHFKNSSPRVKKRHSPCQDIIKYKVDLENISFLKYYKDNGLIFSALVNSYNSHKGSTHCELLPLKVLSKDSFAIITNDETLCIDNLQDSSQYRVPIAITFGGNPIYTILSMSHIPGNIGIYSLSGFLLNKRVDVTNALTQNITIASDYDLVLEGYIQKNDELYTDPESGKSYPKIHISCVTYRKEGVIMVNSDKSEKIQRKYINMVGERFLLFALNTLHNINIIDLHLFEDDENRYIIFKLPDSMCNNIQRVAKRVIYSEYVPEYQSLIFVNEDITIRNKRDITELLENIDKSKISVIENENSKVITIYNATK